MVAAWDSKYGYDRPRPSAIKADLKAVVPNPLSPSYPAEYAAAAGAAAEVLAYLIPDRAASFGDKAEGGRARVLVAGVNYPSDAAAGVVPGRQVVAVAIERAKADGTDAKWTGNVPNEPGKWTGTNPILRMAGTWLRRTGMADGGSPDDRTPPAPMATRTATSCCPSACSNCCAPPHSEREARFGQIWLISRPPALVRARSSAGTRPAFAERARPDRGHPEPAAPASSARSGAPPSPSRQPAAAPATD